MSGALTPGGRIDASREFYPLRIAIMTVSDSRSAATDSAGDLLAARVQAAGHHVQARALLRHEQAALKQHADQWLAEPLIDAIICNGGTGLGERDIAPEVWRRVFEREFEGFTALWHLVSFGTVGVSTLQSRACAGISAGKVIYVLPGSPGACRDGWDNIIEPQLDSRHRPCSAVELIGRFRRD